MKDTEVIEILCKLQDFNKNLKFNSASEEEVEECLELEENIKNQFASLYVN